MASLPSASADLIDLSSGNELNEAGALKFAASRPVRLIVPSGGQSKAERNDIANCSLRTLPMAGSFRTELCRFNDSSRNLNVVVTSRERHRGIRRPTLKGPCIRDQSQCICICGLRRQVDSRPLPIICLPMFQVKCLIMRAIRNRSTMLASVSKESSSFL